MRLFKTGCAMLALGLFIQPAIAASCITRSDAAALKIAVMRQQLIVAALKCGEAGSYHLFADGFRDELIKADASVQDFFTPRGGKAEYVAFRGKAAKLAWAEQAADADTFCDDARGLLAEAKQHKSLAAFAQSRSGAITGSGFCLPQPAKAAPKTAPAITVRTAMVMPVDAPPRSPVPMKVVPMKAVAVKAAPVNPRVAQAEIAQADFSKTQVEPFRVGYYVPPLDSYAVEEPADDAPLPRPSRRAEDDAPYQRRDWDQRGYGPPPAWNQSWRTAWRDDDDRYDWPQDDGWDEDEDW